jgi:hypothetical protein
MAWFIEPKRRALTLLFCLLGATFSIVFLSFFSGRFNHRKNGFIRLVPPHVAISDKIRDIGYNSYYLAGGTSDHIYLANRSAPGVIMSLDPWLKDSVSHHLDMLSAGGRVAKSLQITIDSPRIYLFDGFTPSIVHGTLGDSLLHRARGKIYFTLAAPISPVSRVYRAVDRRLHQNVLVKQLNDSIIKGDTILEKQVDGIFCTDGSLHSQPDSNRLVYVYTYRNQFVIMDTNMQIRYRGKTIDTVSTVKLRASGIPSQSSITMSSPPEFVNEQSCVSGNYLFIHSALAADNENMSVYNKCSCIDVYSLIDGSYILSFYLPDFHYKKIRDFQVYGNTLAALYDHYIYTYTLHFPDKLKR